MTRTEEQRPTAGFDLEKNRAAIDSAINSLLCEGWDNEASTVRGLVAEIERLRASLVEHEEHEKQTHEVLGNILGTDDTLENVAKRAAASIKELEAEIERLRSELTTANVELIAAGEMVRAKDARIKELEDAIVEELATDIAYEDRVLWSRLDRQKQEEYREKARQQLQAEGKIGPDATKPRSWQITEDRVTAIDQGLRFLEWSNARNGNVETKKRIATLKTMLKEANDEHGFER